MKHLTPQIIAEVTDGKYIGDDALRHERVMGAVRDNRDVVGGNLFICIRGARVDGHDFANSAFDAGAACCLAEREIPDAKGPYVLVDSTLESLKTLGAYYRSLFDIPIIGITGSVGKTTSKEMIAAVLGAKLNVLKTTKNLNNEIGVPLTLLSLEERHEVAVIEMGISDFGEMGRLAQMVVPDIFVITKIGFSHLDNLKDLDGVLRAKTETFAYMKPNSIAILNGDDDLLWNYDPGIKKITYGTNPRNDYVTESQLLTPNVSPQLLTPNSSLLIPNSYGSHLTAAVLLAAVIGDIFGLTEDDIRRGLRLYEPVDGRAKLINTGYITIIDDCYNANPDSVKAALESLSTLSGRRIAILGDMLGLGEHTEQAHQNIGRFAAQSSIESLICCGEHAKHIYEGFLSERTVKTALYVPSKNELMPMLPGIVERNDVILIKASNGMRFDEIVKTLHILQDRN